MNNKNLEYLLECIEKDKEYYNFYNNDFDSFNAKLSNLSTLVTVLLGFLITIGTFIFENEYFNSFNIFNVIGSTLAILTFIVLIILLCLICQGQSFKKNFTIQAKFPIKTAEEANNNSDLKVFYRKMVFCLYKIVRTSLENLEISKKYFPHAFTAYIFCVIMSLISLILICIGSI